MAKGLTDRQRSILKFIHDYILENSFPPTLRDMGEHFHISIKGCYDHLKALEHKGYIDRGPSKKSRSIRIINHIFSDDTSNTLHIPIVGLVQAGSPVLAESNYEGNIEIARSRFGEGTFFALRVRGDSMIDEGIVEGDLGIVKQQRNFENGEIIVAQMEEGITLKKGYKEKNKLRLEPANINYAPIYTRDATIIGKLVGIIRNY